MPSRCSINRGSRNWKKRSESECRQTKAFGVPGYLRLSFANDEATLKEALVRLERVVTQARSVAEATAGEG